MLMAYPSETVISLGNVALGALRRLLGSDAVAPGETLQEIYDAGLYGSPGTLRIGDRDVEWFALAHPGLLKGKGDLPRATRRWHEAHDKWGRKMRARCGDAPRDETMHGA
jgi:hypothetical protein